MDRSPKSKVHFVNSRDDASGGDQEQWRASTGVCRLAEKAPYCKAWAAQPNSLTARVLAEVASEAIPISP